jgi:predicted nucleic acid-binding protein
MPRNFDASTLWIGREEEKWREQAHLLPLPPLPAGTSEKYRRIRVVLERNGPSIANHDSWIAQHALAADLFDNDLRARISARARTEDSKLDMIGNDERDSI